MGLFFFAGLICRRRARRAASPRRESL